MVIKSVQKVIKVGDSLAVTIPAKDARASGIDKGEEVEVTIKPVATPKDHKDLMREYDQFVDQYGQTLKNLKDR